MKPSLEKVAAILAELLGHQEGEEVSHMIAKKENETPKKQSA